MIKKIIFAFGSNLGDRNFYISEALNYLMQRLELSNLKRSSIIENKAMLLEGSPKSWDIDFLNMVISADINIEKFPPLEILQIIKEVEKQVGRNHREKWAPREIDIDILTIEELRVEIDGKLIIPHYDLKNRDFLIKLIKEIEPDWRF
jgi:2-amino-4-hydroxy-6-hydroxymethyldihydropteridine diphosphokinase/dihydropteroate synthase